MEIAEKVPTKLKVRESIVNVARDVFAKYGYNKTTMDDIAHTARRGKTSIYYYFRSKEEIFRAVIEKEAALLVSKLKKAIMSVDDPEEKLRIYVYSRMNTFRDLSNFYVALKDELLDHLEFIEEIRERYDKMEIQIITDIFEQGINKNLFKIEDVEYTAVTIITVLKGFELPLYVYDAFPDIEDRTDALINIILFGIVKR